LSIKKKFEESSLQTNSAAKKNLFELKKNKKHFFFYLRLLIVFLDKIFIQYFYTTKINFLVTNKILEKIQKGSNKQKNLQGSK